MAYFISHVQPLWSFAAPATTLPHLSADGAAAHRISRPAPIWRWTRAADGRVERRPSEPAIVASNA